MKPVIKKKKKKSLAIARYSRSLYFIENGKILLKRQFGKEHTIPITGIEQFTRLL